MRTPANVFNHPIHPMLIFFTIGLWMFSLICDLARLAGRGDAWATIAFFSMVGGFIGALYAVVPDIIHLLYYKRGAPPVKSVALTHMTINLTAVVEYATRHRRCHERAACAVDHRCRADLRPVSGRLGSQLVHVHGIGVEGLDWRFGEHTWK